MDFLLGCNYWDSAHGTDMWKYYDKDIICEDIKALSQIGVKCMRVFPNWRDFQPVKRLFKWCNQPCDCVTLDEKPLADANGVDPKQIANFRHFANTCNMYGISLVVSVVTGWMSGRMFVPQIIEGKNLIMDPEALMWTNRLIRGFVSQVKDLPNIIMWDLGNECNCMGIVNNHYESYVWTAFVRNAIRAEDPTRPISSGMHGLSSEEHENWTIYDQGEITDYVTTHPYISPTINNDIDPANKLRTTLLPTAQSIYYRDLAGVPVIMQEQGTFSDTTANKEMAADFERVNVFSCLSHNIKGHFWWCGMEHILLDAAPYSWTMMERSLGLLELDKTPKPVGHAICEVSKMLDMLPFRELPEHQIDAGCILTINDRWKNGLAAFVLAKQAGLDIQYSVADKIGTYPADAPMYIVPGVTEWAIMYKHTWDFLKEKVYNQGANMLVTYDGGSLIELENVFGIRSLGNVKSNAHHTATFSFGKLDYSVTHELLIETVGAKVLAVDEEGNVVMTEHQYGNGKVYFVNMPLERYLSDKVGAFNETDYYKIYQLAADNILRKKVVTSGNPQIGITLHKVNDQKYIVCAVNYSDKTQETKLNILNGWRLTPIYGQITQIAKCNGAFYYAEKE